MRVTCLAACLLTVIVPAATNAQDIRFETSVVLPIAEPLPNAFRLAIGDVNGDGMPDIVVGSAAGVVLILNQPESHFDAGRVIPISSPCPIPDVALADLDRDGIVDLAVYNGRATAVLTNGDGTLRTASTIAVTRIQ